MLFRENTVAAWCVGAIVVFGILPGVRMASATVQQDTAATGESASVPPKTDNSNERQSPVQPSADEPAGEPATKGTTDSQQSPTIAVEPGRCAETFRVALDVGHTPQLFGTLTARGRTEYEFNLNLANTIQATLIERGYKNVYLIKMTGDLGTLPQRDVEANRLKA